MEELLSVISPYRTVNQGQQRQLMPILGLAVLLLISEFVLPTVRGAITEEDISLQAVDLHIFNLQWNTLSGRFRLFPRMPFHLQTSLQSLSVTSHDKSTHMLSF